MGEETFIDLEAEEADELLRADSSDPRWQTVLDHPTFRPAGNPRLQRKGSTSSSLQGTEGAVASPGRDGGEPTTPEEAQELWGQLLETFPQSSINGTHNIWIAKPGGKSRGRGIALFSNLQEVLSYCTPLKGEKWIVQKYIERPLLVHRRKFDIRQWVMVTDWNPLVVWFYEGCYLRFAADDFDASDLGIYGHLSNNSISKHQETGRDDEITQAGNMWTVERFRQHLQESGWGPRAWEEVVLPQMKETARQVLAAAVGEVRPRKNSCELYGLDLMVDDSLKVWLLEINSSPTLEASTDITRRLCSQVQEDIVKLVVDLPDHLAAQTDRCSSGGEAEASDAFDTGLWRCILRGQAWQGTGGNYMGLSLACRGTGFKAMEPKKVKRGKPSLSLYNLATICAPTPEPPLPSRSPSKTGRPKKKKARASAAGCPGQAAKAAEAPEDQQPADQSPESARAQQLPVSPT